MANENTLANPLPISGVAAAILIPRSDDGTVDLPRLGQHVDFLMSRGIEQFALNGATGEYPLTTEQEFSKLARFVRSRLGSQKRLVTGVGGPSLEVVRRLCDIAADSGSDGLLLPMPYFFPYNQDDLKAFVKEISESLRLPTYLYNLPSFTTPLEPATTVELALECKNIVGTKDSSGSLDTVRLLRSRQGGGCILGNDGALYAGLSEGICDGVVSGVACVLPELMIELYQSVQADARSERSLHLKTQLDEFISWLDRFPVPWGLKIIAEVRGLGKAYFPLPLSPERISLRKDFVRWFSSRQRELLAPGE